MTSDTFPAFLGSAFASGDFCTTFLGAGDFEGFLGVVLAFVGEAVDEETFFFVLGAIFSTAFVTIFPAFAGRAFIGFFRLVLTAFLGVVAAFFAGLLLSLALERVIFI